MISRSLWWTSTPFTLATSGSLASCAQSGAAAVNSNATATTPVRHGEKLTRAELRTDIDRSFEALWRLQLEGATLSAGMADGGAADYSPNACGFAMAEYP